MSAPATAWSKGQLIVNLGVLMNDSVHTMNDSIATMNDEKPNPNTAQPTQWTVN